MQDLNVIHEVQNAGTWLVRHQTLLLTYAVNIVAAILILIVGKILARLISKGLNRVLKKRDVDVTVADFLSALVRYGIIAFTLIAALGRLGVQTASVIAVLGAAGLAVGLALQGSLSNLAAGVLLVTFRPFRTGELVDLGGVSGTVTSVQIFSTTLHTPDGRTVVIPNAKIIAGNIINFSREPARRNEFIIGVSYDADVDHVIALLRSVVDAEPRVMHDKEVQIGLHEMAASSLNFIVRCWSNNENFQLVYWDLMAGFKRVLDANGVGIPYPQMDVHLHQAKSGAE